MVMRLTAVVDEPQCLHPVHVFAVELHGAPTQWECKPKLGVLTTGKHNSQHGNKFIPMQRLMGPSLSVSVRVHVHSAGMDAVPGRGCMV